MRRREREAATAGRSRRGAAWLSIAAVLLQLVVSAWHIHPEDYAFAATAVSGVDHALSSTPQPAAPGHEDCALCVTLQLATGSALPDGGSVAPPSTADALPPAMPEALHLASAPYLLFRTRAPPAA